MAVEAKHRVYAGFISTDETHDIDLGIYLTRAENKVVLTDYPYGYTDIQKAASLVQYVSIVDELFETYWAKRGAEGQSSHSENGIARGYRSEAECLSSITPHVCSIN